MSSTQNKFHGPLLRSGKACIGLEYLDLFGDIITDIDSHVTEGEVILTD